MTIEWLENCSDEELFEKKVFCRVDFNVPLDSEQNVVDASRIEMALPTLRKLRDAKAKVIVASHLGRPKGKVKQALSLEPVAQYLRDLLGCDLTFVHDCVGDGVRRIIDETAPGSVTFLENLRFHPGEEKNDPVFCKMLAKNADIFVNDAFGCVHRSHASVDGMTHLIDRKIGGMLLKREVDWLSSLRNNAEKPFVALIGGAKVSTKIGVLQKLLQKVDAILIGGAMAYTFLASKGHCIGKSLIEQDKLTKARSILDRAKEMNVEIHLPSDHVVCSDFKTSEGMRNTLNICEGEMGVDIGPQSVNEFSSVIKSAKTIFWNGPMGIFEHEKFCEGTMAIAKALAESSGKTIVGGGDSVAALKKAQVIDKIDFVSSGGGASLEFIEGKELPGLKALGYYS